MVVVGGEGRGVKAEDVIRAMTAPPVKVEVMMMKEGRSQPVSALRCEDEPALTHRRPSPLSLTPPPHLSSPPLSLLSLKLECDKLASEKSEMQRHYIMVSEARLRGGIQTRAKCASPGPLSQS